MEQNYVTVTLCVGCIVVVVRLKSATAHCSHLTTVAQGLK